MGAILFADILLKTQSVQHFVQHVVADLQRLQRFSRPSFSKSQRAQQFVQDTVYWMPFLSAENWTYVIGLWEILIAICFLFKKTTIIAMILLFVQMSGTFLPLIILPEVTFQDSNPFFPTLEGQYIIKNIIIITAALVIGRAYLKVKII